MKFILLNGPPRSGKDTAAIAVQNALHSNGQPCMHEKFSAPLKYAFAGMTQAHIKDFVVEHFEAIKDTKITDWGFSFRQWQQDFSEKFMKPLYGNDIFGKLLMDRLGDLDKDIVVVISDCGFRIEIDYLLGKVDPEDVLLIRCYRPDYSFDGDTREYVYSEQALAIDLHNTSTLENWNHNIVEAVKYFISGGK